MSTCLSRICDGDRSRTDVLGVWRGCTVTAVSGQAQARRRVNHPSYVPRDTLRSFKSYPPPTRLQARAALGPAARASPT